MYDTYNTCMNAIRAKFALSVPRTARVYHRTALPSSCCPLAPPAAQSFIQQGVYIDHIAIRNKCVGVYPRCEGLRIFFGSGRLRLSTIPARSSCDRSKSATAARGDILILIEADLVSIRNFGIFVVVISCGLSFSASEIFGSLQESIECCFLGKIILLSASLVASIISSKRSIVVNEVARSEDFDSASCDWS
jgi:hypothetical protein